MKSIENFNKSKRLLDASMFNFELVSQQLSLHK